MTDVAFSSALLSQCLSDEMTAITSAPCPGDRAQSGDGASLITLVTSLDGYILHLQAGDGVDDLRNCKENT